MDSGGPRKRVFDGMPDVVTRVLAAALIPTALGSQWAWTKVHLDDTWQTHEAKANLEPPHIEEELEHCEERNNEVDTVTVVVLLRVQELTSK